MSFVERYKVPLLLDTFRLCWYAGTMGDDEMRQLNVPALQDDGYIFLWVTGIYIPLSHVHTHNSR